MMKSMTKDNPVPGRLVLLGPQRRDPIVCDAVEGLLGKRPERVAAVTAGWEEREAEIEELDQHLGCTVVDLRVYGRVEEVFQKDPELLDAMRQRHDRLREVQEIYRMRLRHALNAARNLWRRAGDESLLEPEREAAIAAVRELDRHHLGRIDEVYGEFEQRWQPGSRPEVARHRQELAKLLADTPLLCVAGGHVNVLLQRMMLFDVVGLHGQRPIVAWSAGAMVLCERVVLFHDSPPQGPGNPEVMGRGFGRCRGAIVLPHGQRRLKLDDTSRVALFARRFQPEACMTLDPGSRLDWDGRRFTHVAGSTRLQTTGRVEAGAAV
jgi:hypothetical protein